MPDAILVKAFAQANTVKGFRYLDDAGRVMNEYSDSFPDMTVGFAGLVLKNPSASFDEARVSVRDIWTGFSRPATTRFVTDQAERFIRNVSSIIAVDKFTRLGLRLQYVYPQAQTAPAVRRLAGLVLGSPLTGLSDEPKSFDAAVQFAVADDMTSQLRIQPVHLAEPSQDETLPREGLMLDADVSKEGQIPIGELRAFLRNAARWADETLPVLASRIASGD